MNRHNLLRLAAVVSLAAFAGACDSPMAARGDNRGPTRPAYNLPVATMSVTNSGGTPLVSWNAVSGATSYNVRLITYQTLNGAYQRRFFQLLTSTTGTSYLDTGNSYTGVYQCENAGEDPYGNVYGYWYEYEVVSVFPTGTSSARYYAPITSQYC